MASPIYNSYRSSLFSFVDPLKVIRLFPNLLTTRMKDLLKEPAYSTPLLTGIQADEARGGLIDYLNSVSTPSRVTERL